MVYLCLSQDTIFIMEISKTTKIAVLCGGISSEREISIKSGQNCFNALLRLGYKNTIIVDIKSIEDIVSLKSKEIQIAFLVTHGKFGEDGAIQGILEWLKIPYTGSSVLGSSITMDKWITKHIAKNLNILTPKGFLLTNENKNNINLKEIWEDLSNKAKGLFIKPRDDGSSVNVFKIKSLSELKEKIRSLNLTESDFIIEEFISGREITVSVIEVNNKFKVLPVLELKPKNEFYDYEAKYTKGMTDFILPSKIEEACLKKIENDSTKLLSTISCSSFARVDYILDPNNNFYLLEINSLPGMTDTSDLPAQAQEAGIKYDELVEIILKTARLHKT